MSYARPEDFLATAQALVRLARLQSSPLQDDIRLVEQRRPEEYTGELPGISCQHLSTSAPDN